MVNINELRELLNREVIFKKGENEFKAKITIINDDSETFHYEYSDPYRSAGSGGCDNIINIVGIEDNIIIFR